MTEKEYNFSPELMIKLQRMALNGGISRTQKRIRTLEKNLKRVQSLKARHPDLVDRPNDKDLKAKEYKIWQSIHTESLILEDIEIVEAKLAGLEKKAYRFGVLKLLTNNNFCSRKISCFTTG
ncbi:MAG: hypothetical protein HN981_01965 [Candidatus Pacebacteria bacterium]|jgi:hypothetical protein|nr:hypothetical protein [Candidatus Paceibacterota bacterium]MBT6755929.1 hypothetical protein [Candidatus Paceibacterota bacterium]MBT6921142.1 hypothetical protein [Candidatus Paceibacterota bacterium]